MDIPPPPSIPCYPSQPADPTHPPTHPPRPPTSARASTCQKAESGLRRPYGGFGPSVVAREDVLTLYISKIHIGRTCRPPRDLPARPRRPPTYIYFQPPEAHANLNAAHTRVHGHTTATLESANTYTPPRPPAIRTWGGGVMPEGREGGGGRGEERPRRE